MSYNEGQWELYNIGLDRCETKNLIKDNPEKAESMKKLWVQWAERVKLSPYYKHK
jgi:hypothetical protein